LCDRALVLKKMPIPLWSYALGDTEKNRLGNAPDSGSVKSQRAVKTPVVSIDPHLPVLLDEVLQVFQPVMNGIIVDGTFGAGGYSKALAAKGAKIIAIDRDGKVKPFANDLKNQFGEMFSFHLGQFSQLDEIVAASGCSFVDGVILDIGVSSMQLDQGERGFSFMRDGPLDMRMGQSGPSAADLVNGLGERELSDLIFAYGEEKRARAIAKAIVDFRRDNLIVTTAQLAKLVEDTIGQKGNSKRMKAGKPVAKKHPATKVFQALRIAVNNELDELVKGLFSAERIVREGGWLGVVTFHSLEDRIVKRFFDANKSSPTLSRHMPQEQKGPQSWSNIGKAKKASTTEIAANPRARSATLRFAQRSASDPRDLSFSGLGVPLSKGVSIAKLEKAGSKSRGAP